MGFWGSATPLLLEGSLTAEIQPEVAVPLGRCFPLRGRNFPLAIDTSLVAGRLNMGGYGGLPTHRRKT